ncbi:hypothetical protein [Mesorhizobium escarrei]
MQQIERDEIEVVLAPGDCLAQRGKIRKASLIQDDDFAVDDGVLYVETFGCFDQIAVFGGPVESAAGENPRIAGIDDDLGAVPSNLASCIQSSPWGGLATKVGIIGGMNLSRRAPELTILRTHKILGEGLILARVNGT